MKFKQWKIAGVAAVAAAFAFSSTSANAGAAFTPDGDGVDYDAACVVSTATSPPPQDNMGSPGGAGCPGVSTYDGSTLATDLRTIPPTPSVCPGVTASTALCMSTQPSSTTSPPNSVKFNGGWNVGQNNLPAPGSTSAPTGTVTTLDTPNQTFGGVQYFTMYQNKNVQTNVPTNNTHGGGCARVGAGVVFDQHESWKDGFHFWISYGIHWDGSKWVHSVKIGEYNPSPDGGFFFFEVGVNDGVDDDGDLSLWDSLNPYMKKGIHWDVRVTPHGAGTQISTWTDGKFRTPNPNCANGIFTNVFVGPGDQVANGKALATTHQVVVLPLTVPLSALCGASGGAVCEQDLTSVGGFVHFSDVSIGASTAGALNTNITGISYTGGAVGVTDTMGQGATCPTPTFGGVLPPNPAFTPDTACHIDDDPISRGSFLSEWWDTTLNMIA